jgi:quinol monooxygenase YgiN
MYARLVRFSFAPGKQSAAQALADELAPAIASQPGCAGVTFFIDDKDGEGGLFVLWNSEDAANAAAQIIRPQLDKHLAGNIAAAPDARLFKVILK